MHKNIIKGSDKLKKVPFRTCMGCNGKKAKNELIRIVKNKDNVIAIDKTGKLEGRGAYICNSVACLDKVIKSKRLDKALETEISKEIYDNLRGVMIDQ